MEAKANALIAWPLGKLEPASLSNRMALGIVTYGLGLAMASFIGSVTKVPMTSDAKISMPSLLLLQRYSMTLIVRMERVDPSRVRMLKSQPRCGLARPLLIKRKILASQA